MQGLAQRCDIHSSSDAYGTVLERAQYHGTMRDIVEHLMSLRPTFEEQSSTQDAGDRGPVYTTDRRRTWSYDNASLKLSAEVPQLQLELVERNHSERRPGYLLSTERISERLDLTLRVNNDAHTDAFSDYGEKEWSYGLVGERYRRHDVGRWRGYSPEAARIASVVLRCLEHPQEMPKVAAELESRVA